MATSWSQRGRNAASSVRHGLGAYSQTGVHRRGMSWMRAGFGAHRGFGGELKGLFTKGGRLGAFGGLAGRALGAGFGISAAVSGYQKEGLWGATKGVAGYAATNYALGAVFGSAAVGAAVIGGTVGGAMLRKAAINIGEEYGRAHSNTEFGGGVDDRYGRVTTMRRRSMMAINRSRIGGNMGLGNEALNSYVPYNR